MSIVNRSDQKILVITKSIATIRDGAVVLNEVAQYDFVEFSMN